MESICPNSVSSVALVVKNSPTNAGDLRCGFHPWMRRIPWRRKWQPTPVFLPGEIHGQRSLVGDTVHSGAKSRIRLPRMHAPLLQIAHFLLPAQSSPRLPFMVHPPGTPALDTEGLKLSLGPSPSQCSVLPQPIPSLSPEALQAERQLSYGNDGCAAQLFFSVGAERKKKEKTQVLGEGSLVCV